MRSHHLWWETDNNFYTVMCYSNDSPCPDHPTGHGHINRITVLHR